MRPLLSVCLLSLLIAGCDESKETAAAPPPKPAVGVRPAVTRGVRQSFEFVGRIKAIDKVELRARVEGFLDKVLFREGQDVKTGDLLYQIEKVQFQAQLDQAKANLAVGRGRGRPMPSSNMTAPSSSSKRNSSVRRARSTRTRRRSTPAAARVMQMQAALTQAEVNLDYTDIRAPIDGRIGRTAYTVGNLVNPASGVLATIVSQDPIYVLFPVSVRDLEIIREARRKEGGGLAKIEIRHPPLERPGLSPHRGPGTSPIRRSTSRPTR